MNLKHPRGLEIVQKLVKQADVLVENFLPGKLSTLGLGWDACHSINQRLIYASISGIPPFCRCIALHFLLICIFVGYGQTGPYAHAAGYDVVIEAEAGLMHM